MQQTLWVQVLNLHTENVPGFLESFLLFPVCKAPGRLGGNALPDQNSCHTFVESVIVQLCTQQVRVWLHAAFIVVTSAGSLLKEDSWAHIKEAAMGRWWGSLTVVTLQLCVWNLDKSELFAIETISHFSRPAAAHFFFYPHCMNHGAHRLSDYTNGDMYLPQITWQTATWLTALQAVHWCVSLVIFRPTVNPPLPRGR